MFVHKYNSIISIENLLSTWNNFLCGKRYKKDVVSFQSKLSDNILDLYNNLKNKTYKHGPYSEFNITDPKPRIIHKASVCDRVVHHLIYKELYWYFDNKFIYDSYSCRKFKGVHKSLDRFRYFARKVSKNNSRNCFVLKCDIRKFFASIDHGILNKILERHIQDQYILWLINQVINSFSVNHENVGMPLGNLTSQLLANIYMNEFDRFVKQKLRVKFYLRYADDFVILSDNKQYLNNLTPKIDKFLKESLHLTLHDYKVYIKTWSSGLDFLGWVHFPYHRQMRTVTKRRILKKMKRYPKPETVMSYKGLLGHGNTYKILKIIKQTGN